MKIAIVGVGNVAKRNYLPFLKDQPEVELGLFNRNASIAEAACKTFEATQLHTLEEVRQWNPCSVLVLTSETARYEMASRLIELGVKRLFCEKPLVAAKGQAHVTERDFECGRNLLALAEKNGCEVALNFNYRFFDQTICAKEVARSRNFGRVVQVGGQVHFACWSHCIDLVHFFAGEVMEITAFTGDIDRAGQGILAPDVVAAFRLEGGGMGTLIGTAGMKWQHPLFELTFTYENGRIHMRDIDGDLEILDGDARVHERISMVRDSSRWDAYNTSFKKALAAYLESVRAGEIAPVTGRDGLRELQVEAALKRSVAEKRPVRVKDEFP